MKPILAESRRIASAGKCPRQVPRRWLPAPTDTLARSTVIGAIARKGNVVCKVIENTSAETLSRLVEKTVCG